MGFAGDNNRAIGSPILTGKNYTEKGFERKAELILAFCPMRSGVTL